jgi:recombination protein RecT
MSTENTQLEVVKKDITAQVLSKINTFTEAGELKLPKDYSVENALKSAYITLTDNPDGKGSLLDKCDKSSIAEALLKMVIYGLTPQKKQVYFVPYGNKLTCVVSYMGNIATAKRYNPNVSDIKARAITKGEEFEFEFQQETGAVKILKHKQTLESIGNKEIVGAYSLIYYKDGTFEVGDIMNIEQIKQAWNQGAMKGGSPAHKNFPDEMSKRTVINRTCKRLINTSSDAILMEDELLEEQLPDDTAKANLVAEKERFADAQVIGFETVETVETEKVNPDTPEATTEKTEASPENNSDQAAENVVGPGY